MDSATSEPAEPAEPADPDPRTSRRPLHASADNGLKIVVVGGFGVGKTTLVRSISEIRPLSTEETMTRAGEAVDDVSAVRDKNATTVAFDFGRITLDARNVLYLFGAPGQKRFWFLWDRLFAGALGAVVLVDTRRLDDSWYAIDRLERHGTPFVVARNDFGGPDFAPQAIRDALDLDPAVPLVHCDARVRSSSKRVLIALVEHVKHHHQRSRSSARASSSAISGAGSGAGSGTGSGVSAGSRSLSRSYDGQVPASKQELPW